MSDKIWKNPVLHAIIAIVIVYMYLSWKRSSDIKNKKRTSKYVNIIIPFIAGVIVYFLSVGYYKTNTNISNISNVSNVKQTVNNEFEITPSKYKQYKLNEPTGHKYSLNTTQQSNTPISIVLIDDNNNNNVDNIRDISEFNELFNI